ncbi:MAG: trypsin-like peptidase domain-containing protein [Planctomycetota bacterium]
MLIHNTLRLGMLAAAVALAPVAHTQPDAASEAEAMSFAKSLSRAFNTVASDVSPSVVFIQRRDTRIVGQRRDFFGRIVRPGREQLFDSGNGSGVIVSGDGLILTNNHVIEDAEALEVQLIDGRAYDAEILGADPATDIAVLRIDAEGLEPAQLGDSDELKVGDWVLALGSPFGLSNTVTAGIVSAKGRDNVLRAARRTGQSGGVQYEEFIQTDAAINPGNSGGPLVNLEGEVVGINTAIFSRSGGNIGLSFAVPTAIAERVMRTIVEDGRVARGWLGVTLEDLTADDEGFMGIGRGALVTSVVPGSPAEQAGFEEGDVILTADGREAENSRRLINTIALSGPGRDVEFLVLRGEDEQRRTATLADREAFERRREAERRRELGIEDVPELGLAALPLDEDTRRALDRDFGDQGLLVVEIEPRGRAQGLRAGDVILRADGRDVEEPDDLDRAIRQLRRGDSVELFVIRGSRRGTIVLQPSLLREDD